MPGRVDLGPWSCVTATPSDLCFGLAARRPGRGPQAAAREKLGGLPHDIYDEPESPMLKTCGEGRV